MPIPPRLIGAGFPALQVKGLVGTVTATNAQVKAAAGSANGGLAGAFVNSTVDVAQAQLVTFSGNTNGAESLCLQSYLIEAAY